MGTWNFSSPEVTDGIKIIATCQCQDYNDCYCEKETSLMLEKAIDRLSSISAVLEYSISKEYSLCLQLESIEPTIEHGYYYGVALDYDQDYEVEIQLFKKNGDYLPDVSIKENYAELKNVLDNIALPINYREELLWAVQEGKDTITLEGSFLSVQDRKFFNSILSNHANAVIPVSVSAGWCSGEYQTFVTEPELPENDYWSASCSYKTEATKELKTTYCVICSADTPVSTINQEKHCGVCESPYSDGIIQRDERISYLEKKLAKVSPQKTYTVGVQVITSEIKEALILVKASSRDEAFIQAKKKYSEGALAGDKFTVIGEAKERLQKDTRMWKATLEK